MHDEKCAVRDITAGGHGNVLGYADYFDRSDVPLVENDESFQLHCNDAINIQFTSGTTGLPKAVELSHTNIVNNAVFIAAQQKFSATDTVCVPPPLYHCFGLVLGSLACAATGAQLVLPWPTFDAEKTLEAVESEGATALYGVPTMFINQLTSKTFHEYTLSTLRTGIMAGSICPSEIMRRTIEEMHLDEITIAFGMTETAPVSFQSAADTPFEKRVTTVGRVHPHVEAKVVASSGNICEVNVPGELLVRGYNVMRGYQRYRRATQEVITSDGWMKTGDLATIDEDGYATIVGRLKDTIIRGGENIAPREVEDCLFNHDAVEIASVVGVPDELLGQQVCACIVLSSEAHAFSGNGG